MTEGQMPSGQMEPKNPTSAAQETPKSQLQEMPYIPDGPASVGGTQTSDLGLAQWNPWSQREGSTAIWAPAITSRGENRLDLFAVGLDSQVYHQSWNGSQWSPWKGLGDPKSITPPAAVALGSNRLSVFWVGTDKQVYSRTGDGNQWGEVESLGGTVIHGVAATSWGTNRIDLFAVGTDSSLYQNYWNGSTWSGWKILRFKGQERVEKSATCISAPAAVSWGANRIDIFTLGIDNGVYHAWGDGTSEWKGWENLGGPCIQGVAAASRGVNRLDLFAISTDTVGTDNHLYYRSGNGSNWSRWENLGGACISAPTAVAQGEKRLDVFVVGTRSAIWQKSWVKGDDTLGVSEVPTGMVETTLTMVNNTPLTMQISATIANESDWADSIKRPDKNLISPNGNPLILKSFETFSVPENISSSAKSAKFTVKVAATYTNATNSKSVTDNLNFTTDQYWAISPPDTSKQDDNTELPPNTAELATSSPYYVVLQQFVTDNSNKKQLTLFISEKR
jgi:hypothetical protein